MNFFRKNLLPTRFSKSSTFPLFNSSGGVNLGDGNLSQLIDNQVKGAPRALFRGIKFRRDLCV